MTVETATFIADLQAVNPPSADPVAQGDDHIRLIKQVLQNSFSGSTRVFQIPSARSISTSGSIILSDGESTIYCSTASGPVTLTLPALASGDKGWRVSFIKTSLDVNPMFIIPASGSINSGGFVVAKARRCIPGKRVTAVWDGTNWFIERVLGLPMGVMLDFWGTSLPAGYEWPNGQTLASVSTNYPELAASYGTGALPDIRGYTCATLDNLGGTAAGRLPNGIISGSTLGAVGGVDAVILGITQIPSHFHGAGIYDPQHSHSYTSPSANTSSTGGGAFTLYGCGTPTFATTTTSSATGVRVNSANGLDTTASVGGGGQHSNMQPTIMCAKILVVE